MPAATRVQFCVLVEVTWYPTEPPVYPRWARGAVPTTMMLRSSSLVVLVVGIVGYLH